MLKINLIKWPGKGQKQTTYQIPARRNASSHPRKILERLAAIETLESPRLSELSRLAKTSHHTHNSEFKQISLFQKNNPPSAGLPSNVHPASARLYNRFISSFAVGRELRLKKIGNTYYYVGMFSTAFRGMAQESECALAIIENVSERFNNTPKGCMPTLIPIFFAKFLLCEGEPARKTKKIYCLVQALQGGKNEVKAVERLKPAIKEPIANFTLRELVHYCKNIKEVAGVGLIKADENPYMLDLWKKDRDAMRGLYGLAGRAAGFQKVQGSRYTWLMLNR